MPSPAVFTFLIKNGFKLEDLDKINKCTPKSKNLTPTKTTPTEHPTPTKATPTKATPTKATPTKNYSISRDGDLLILTPCADYQFLIILPNVPNDVKAALMRKKGTHNTIRLEKNQQATIDPYGDCPDIIKN